MGNVEESVGVRYDSDDGYMSDGTDVNGSEERLPTRVRPEDQFPPCISETLALRISVMDYDSSDMVAFVDRPSDVDLETKYGLGEGTVAVTRRYDPIHAYPMSFGDTCYVMSNAFESLATMAEVVSSLRRQNRAWVMSNCSVSDVGLTSLEKRMAELYASPPMHVYTAVSIKEMNLLKSTDREAWLPLFDAPLTSPRRVGLYGTIMDNSTVDVRPYEDSSTYDIKSNPDLRGLKAAWHGFIDPGYTVNSQDAGRVRSLVHKVRIRVATTELFDRLEILAEIIDKSAGNSLNRPVWTVYFMRLTYRVPTRTIVDLIDAWTNMLGHNVPSLHVFEEDRLVVVSSASGCLMRPLSIISDLGCEHHNGVKWLDSMVFNSAPMRKSLRVDPLIPVAPLEYVRTHALMFPYFLHNATPRPTLATIMSTQAVCRPSVSLMSTVTPRFVSPPVVRTPLMDVLCQSVDNVSYFDVPGVDLVVLFANFIDTYEDSAIISSEINDMGLFDSTSTVAHPVPPHVRDVEVGSVIRPDTHDWWRPADNGKVVYLKYSVTRGRYIIAEMESFGLRVGDKLATQHGQKQTVSKVLSRDEMPTCFDKRSGSVFKPHIVLASSSVHNRMTPGQVYEARAGALACNVANFDPRVPHVSHITTSTGSDAAYLPISECNFTHLRSDDLVMLSLGKASTPCTADYGICRFWSLAHLVRDKQHFSSRVPSAPQGPTGRLTGSSVRIGEGELSAMLSKGWIHTVSEMLDSSDQAIVPICSVCQRLTVLCDCPSPCPSATDVVMRSGLVRFDVIRAVYTSNVELGRLGAYYDEESDGINVGGLSDTLSGRDTHYEDNEAIADDVDSSASTVSKDIPTRWLNGMSFKYEF